MKKSSAKKSSRVSFKKNSKQKITWFGIDIYRIGLGVAFVGAIVSFLLVKQEQSFEEQQTAVLAAENHMPMMMNGYSHESTLSARPRCIPRPVGFNPTAASASGKYKEILARLCPPNPSVTPREFAYKGCKIALTCTPTATQSANGHCLKQIICPSGTPFPKVTFPAMTCVPRPPCLDNTHGPKCLIAEPKGGWCPHVSVSISVAPSLPASSGAVSTTTSEGNSLVVMWNNFLRKLLGR